MKVVFWIAWFAIFLVVIAFFIAIGVLLFNAFTHPEAVGQFAGRIGHGFMTTLTNK